MKWPFLQGQHDTRSGTIRKKRDFEISQNAEVILVDQRGTLETCDKNEYSDSPVL